jgi:hypothetical protein
MPPDEKKLEPLAVSPKQATQLVPIGLTKLYEAINSGPLSPGSSMAAAGSASNR